MKGDFLQWPNFLYNPYFMENHSQYCEISRQSSENEVSHGLFLPRTQNMRNMSFTQRHILYFLPYLSIFLIDYTCYHHVCLDLPTTTWLACLVSILLDIEQLFGAKTRWKFSILFNLPFLKSYITLLPLRCFIRRKFLLVLLSREF